MKNKIFQAITFFTVILFICSVTAYATEMPNSTATPVSTGTVAELSLNNYNDDFTMAGSSSDKIDLMKSILVKHDNITEESYNRVASEFSEFYPSALVEYMQKNNVKIYMNMTKEFMEDLTGEADMHICFKSRNIYVQGYDCADRLLWCIANIYNQIEYPKYKDSDYYRSQYDVAFNNETEKYNFIKRNNGSSEDWINSVMNTKCDYFGYGFAVFVAAPAYLEEVAPTLYNYFMNVCPSFRGRDSIDMTLLLPGKYLIANGDHIDEVENKIDIRPNKLVNSSDDSDSEIENQNGNIGNTNTEEENKSEGIGNSNSDDEKASTGDTFNLIYILAFISPCVYFFNKYKKELKCIIVKGECK